MAEQIGSGSTKKILIVLLKTNVQAPFQCLIGLAEDGVIKIYDHDEVVNSLSGSILETESWNINGNYSWPKTPNTYSDIITVLNV